MPHASRLRCSTESWAGRRCCDAVRSHAGTSSTLGEAICELVDELTEHARVLTSIPSPISEWQPGDGPDDERWRGLTEIERREVLAIVSGYENLIGWGEEIARRPGMSPQKIHEACEYLRAERARIERFRQEMGFLERRRFAG